MHTKHICATSWAQIVAKGFFNIYDIDMTDILIYQDVDQRFHLQMGRRRAARFCKVSLSWCSGKSPAAHCWAMPLGGDDFPGREKSARWGWGTYQALQGRSWKQPSSLDFIVNWSIADPWIFSRKFPALVYVLVTWSCESSLSSDVPLAVPENFTNRCED